MLEMRCKVSWLFACSILAYCICGRFVSYQQTHLANFGGLKDLEVFFSLSVLFGRLSQVAYLVLFAWTYAWWAPLAVVFVSSLYGTLLHILLVHPIMDMVVGSGEKSPSSKQALSSVIGFGIWPISAVLMYVLFLIDKY